MANLSVRYATALLQLAEETRELDIFLEQAQFLCQTFEGEEGALRILTHPLIAADDKKSFVNTTYGAIIHPHLIGFMKLSITKNRESVLLSTLRTLIEMIKLKQFQITARVVTAIELSDAQKSKLAHILSVKTGKNVELDIIIDPTIIAGLSVQIDGYYLDRTTRGILKGMRDSFEIA